MTYVFCITGKGEGCDYTIGCNMKFETHELANTDDAYDKAREIFEWYGSDSNRIEAIDIYEVSNVCHAPVGNWAEETIKESRRRELKDKVAKAEAELKKLQKDLEKANQ